MASVMSELEMLVAPPRYDEDVAYKPFPAFGEPVFVTHPAFQYDESLRDILGAYGIGLWLIVKNEKTGPATPAFQSWLEGKTRIPDDKLEVMLERRAEWLAEEGLPADTPIGYQLLPNPPKSMHDRWWRSAKRNAALRAKRHESAARERTVQRETEAAADEQRTLTHR